MEQSKGHSDVTDQENGELAGAILVASERLLRSMNEWEQSAGRPTQTGTSNVSINAGGTGLLIAIGCCVMISTFFIAGAIVSGYMISDLKAEIRRLQQTDENQQAYLNVLMQGRTTP